MAEKKPNTLAVMIGTAVATIAITLGAANYTAIAQDFCSGLQTVEIPAETTE